MSTSGNADTQKKHEAKTENKKETFEDKVNDVVNKAKKEDGTFGELPDNISEELKIAAKNEIKYRNTQSEYTKNQQKLSKLELDHKKSNAKLKLLEETAVPKVEVKIPENRRAELEDLRDNDPEAWRQEMNKLEAEQTKTARQSKLSELSELDKKIELERREEVLTEFRKQHPNVEITDEFIENEVPPRYVKELENGEVTFEQFLQNVAKYAPQGTTVAKDSIKETPNLGSMGGGSEPTTKAKAEESKLDYQKAVY